MVSFSGSKTMLASFASLVALTACHADEKPKAPPPLQVEVLSLAPTELRDTSEYLGTLISRQTVNVLPQVGGYVRKIAVRPGQKVDAGTTLLEVDQRQETAALESASAQSDLAKQTLARTEQLYKEGLVSAQELEAAQAATRSAEAAATQRRVQQQYYTVRAPFSGTIGDVVVRVGDFVQPSTVLTSIAQADVLEVGISVPPERARKAGPETVLEILDKQGAVMVSSNAYFIGPQADPRTQLVDVKAVFRNEVSLRPSEIVRVRAVFGKSQALQVPALAVIRQSGQPFVFVLQEKDGKTTVARKPVTLGDLGDSAYVVLKGLAPGDRIAVSSMQALRDGAVVQPKGVPAS